MNGRISLLICICLAASNVARAQNHQLVFTEKSSTELTATLDGNDYGTVINTSSDHWTWTSPIGINPIYGASGVNYQGPLSWQEPGGESGQNFATTVNFYAGNVAFGFDFVSDEQNPSKDPPVPDGSLGGTISFTSSSGVLLAKTDVYFHDLSDKGTNVPESGSTFGMLSISAVGLIGVARTKVRKASLTS